MPTLNLNLNRIANFKLILKACTPEPSAYPQIRATLDWHGCHLCKKPKRRNALEVTKKTRELGELSRSTLERTRSTPFTMQITALGEKHGRKRFAYSLEEIEMHLDLFSGTSITVHGQDGSVTLLRFPRPLSGL